MFYFTNDAPLQHICCSAFQLSCCKLLSYLAQLHNKMESALKKSGFYFYLGNTVCTNKFFLYTLSGRICSHKNYGGNLIRYLGKGNTTLKILLRGRLCIKCTKFHVL